MNAVVVTGFGGVERLAMVARPDPVLGPGQVAVRVVAVALNPLDWKMMHGQFRLIFRHRPPYVPGFDVSGVVEAVGAGAEASVGERVVAGTARGGGLAERIVVAAKALVRIPAHVSFEEAAAIPGAGCTALQGLRDGAKLREGQGEGRREGRRVLVNGASGGVGTFAVQIARAMGAVVDATCSARNVELVRELGAARVFDYAREDFVRAAPTDAPDAGAGDGAADANAKKYDVVFDAVATRTFAECRGVLKEGGVYVTTLPSARLISEIALTTIAPFTFGGRHAHAIMVRPNARDVGEILRWADEGKVRPVIDRVAAMDEASVREAFTHLGSGRARGKIVVRVGA